MEALSGWIIGAHLLTAHVPATYVEDGVRRRVENGLTITTLTTERSRYEVWTPGLYAMRADGLTVGVYRNSYGDPSVYAGWTWQAGRFALMAGAVAGYHGRPLLPLVAPSVRSDELRVAGHRIGALRVSYMPKVRGGGKHVLHLSIERDLR